MNSVRHINVPNQEFRDLWVNSQLEMCSKESSYSTCLDVGAGQQPYRGIVESLGFEYFSHDFNKYIPTNKMVGFQDPSWDHLEHTFILDILDIPTEQKYNIVLCTEVLEHVPEPALAFEKLIELVAPGGTLIITVPLNSHIHQSPFYFSAGLSPWWFEFHSAKHSLDQIRIEIHGDYADVLSQDISTYFHLQKRFRVRGLSRALSFLIRKIRFAVAPEVLASGGFGTLFTARIRSNESQEN